MYKKCLIPNKSKQIDKYGISFGRVKNNVVYQISNKLSKHCKRGSELKINKGERNRFEEQNK